MAPRTCRRLAITLLATASLALPSSGAAADASVAVPSVEDFFRKPQYLGASLSPSGRYLAVIAPLGEQRGLGIIDLESRALLPTIRADTGDVVRIVWQNDDRLIVFLGDLQRVAGEPPRESAMVVVRRDGSEPRVLASNEGFITRGYIHRTWERPWSVGLQRVVPGSTEILLRSRERSVRSFDLYRFDTATGARALLTFESPGNVSHWVVDFDGIPRAAVVDDIDHDRSAWYVRKSASDAWNLVEEAKQGRLSSTPLQFDPDGKVLYVAARRDGADLSAIYEYDVANGRWGRAIVRHPERDVDAGNASFVVDYRARRLLGLRYANDRPSFAWLDAEYARIQKAVDASLPDTVNVIQGGEDAKRWIVTAYSDRDPGEVYLLDGKTMRMEKLFAYVPWIRPEAMAPTRWVRYPARDGLAIPALLTVPNGANGKAVPLVVDIHGGPNVEANDWGFDHEMQFFASRGYAVLKPQFRGTRGFGWKHLSSGYRQWGEGMQDDLEDGVKWAIAQGIADPARVCFYGGSYGGYAAIWEAIRNPQLIRCAVAQAAVTSLDYLFDNAQADTAEFVDKSSYWAATIGDPKTERARFKRVSPLDNADKAGVPILLAYGGSDARVPIVHGTDFRATLDKYHKDYEWVQYAAEGHGVNRDENVFDFYRRVDRFLAKFLHGDGAATKPEAAPSPPSSSGVAATLLR